MAGTTNNAIVLGYGVFSINGVDVALCKGGGKLEINREYKQIEADGDYGAVKGRIVKYGSVAKLTINALTIIPESFASYMPAIQISDVTTPVAGKKITGTTSIADTDYFDVKWTGKTKDGKAVIITLHNAINLEKFDWEMKFKEEVISSLTYTATYDEAARTTEPWDIIFAS